MSIDEKKDYCFCTLALGPVYSNAALMLAKDVATYCPEVRIVVLTDFGHLFAQLENADVVAFQSDSPVGCYHDKRYCISEALRRHEYCCYLDADCRLRDAPSPSFLDGCDSGILAWNVASFLPRFANEKAGESVQDARRFNSCDRRLSLARSVAARLEVDLTDTVFLSEVCMCFSRLAPQLNRFFSVWDKYARFLQIRGYGWGEGETIGIVARYLDWTVKGIDPTGWLFKDVLTPASASDQLIRRLRQDRKDLVGRS